MMETQLLWGAAFDVYDQQGGWVWGQEVLPGGMGYVGYMLVSALSLPLGTPTLRICALRAPVFTDPDLKSAVKLSLPLNAGICVQGQEGDYIHAAGLGFVHQNHVAPVDEKGGDFVHIAERHRGLPYIWGAIGSDGLDCSGLVQSALRACGAVNVPRDTDMQESALGHEVERQAGLKRGDLVFWRGHVGIMQDATVLLHANAHHMAVESEALEEAVQRIEKSAGPVTSIKRL